MGQSIGTLFGGNLNAVGLGSSITADEVTQGINLEQHTAIVTGASSGLGKETARVLAKRGAHVILAARKMDIAQDVKSLIISETPTARVEVMPLNLASLKSVRQFADEYKQKDLPLNILVNNAGVFMKDFVASDDGIELMFATHVVGHYLLTMLLLDKMKKSAADSGVEGRIMFTGSEAHRITYDGGINFDHLTDPSSFSAYKSYGQSKTGDILLAKEFGEQLKREGANVTANAANPGAVKTELGRGFFNKSVSDVGYNVSKPFIKTPEQGAATLCYVATRPELNGVSGKYFSDCTQIEPTVYGRSDELGKKVMQFCADFVKAKQPA